MDRYTGPHKFDMKGWISCAPFERLLHMEIVEASDGRATLTMPFLIDFAQGAGLLHGGALVSLARHRGCHGHQEFGSGSNSLCHDFSGVKISLSRQTRGSYRQGKGHETRRKNTARAGNCLQ